MKLKKCLKKIEKEKPDKILKIVEEILEFNRENRKQQGLDLKILTPNQMLKNEIRQLLYSLYRSKKCRKQLYKSLIDII